MKTWEKHGLRPTDVIVLLVFTQDFGAVVGDHNGNHKKIPYEDGMEMAIEAAQANLVQLRESEWQVPSNLIGCPKTAQAFFFGEKKQISIEELVAHCIAPLPN